MNNQPKVLIIDDDDTIRFSLKLFLEDFNYVTEVASNAAEAIHAVEDSSFDIAIVDMRLGNMNGDDLIHQLQQKQRSLRYIIYTGSVNFEIPELLKPLGISHKNILKKPLEDLCLVTDKIKEILD